MATSREVHTHSYQHFEDLQMSAKEFYNEVARRIKKYQYPSVQVSSVLLSESGFLSSKREYLCISRAGMEFKVCAAPFGRSFFVSWYMEEYRSAITEFMARLPLVGWMFRPSPKTYFQLDTELIFCKSIDAIVRSVIAKVMMEHGYTMNDPKQIAE